MKEQALNGIERRQKRGWQELNSILDYAMSMLLELKRTYPKLLNGISRPQNRNMPLLKPKWVI